MCDEEVSAMNDPCPDLIKDVNIHQKLNESSLSYEELFRRLDKNHNARIDVDQLIEYLEKIGMESSSNKRWTIAHVSALSSFFLHVFYEFGMFGFFL